VRPSTALHNWKGRWVWPIGRIYRRVFLDFDLGNADSSSVCWKLVSRRIPFVFYTGRIYTAFRQWPTIPVVLKPASSGLITTLAEFFRANR
jgi:hypothetical protein